MSPLLRYISVPSNISAHYNGMEIPDQSEVDFPTGTTVMLRVPRYVEIVGNYQITIDSSMINEDLMDFPLMVKITDPVILSHPRKNISIKAEGSECYVEIESWDTSEAILWVKVPRIYASVNTILNLSLLDSQNPFVGDTLDPVATNVWSNDYVSVFHLAGNGYDSCTARNHATVDSDIGFVKGKVGLGAEFTNVSTSTGKIMVPDHPEYSPVNNDPVYLNGYPAGRICVQLQWKPTVDWAGQPYQNWRVPLYKGYPGIEYKINVFGSYETYGGRRFYVFNPTGGYGSAGDIGERSGHLPTEPGRWYLLHCQTFRDPRHGGGLVAMYEDGNPGFGIWGVGGDVDQDIGWNNYTLGEGVTGSTPIRMGDTDGPLWIGNNPYSSGPPGSVIDEVRVSRVNRNMAWMKAEYHNMNGELVQITAL